MWTILVPLRISGTLSYVNRVDIFTTNKLKNNLQTYYDRLLGICLDKTKNKVKIHTNYKTNVTKSYNIVKEIDEISISFYKKKINV